MPSSRSATRRVVEIALIVCGMASVAWVATAAMRSSAYTRETTALAETWPGPGARPEFAAAAPVIETLERGAAIGVLSIPRLKFSEAIAEGDDDDTLGVSIGHLPDTPLPWHMGNSVVAAHRDTQFRALEGIRIGDRMRLRTPRGEFAYVVDDLIIVEPNDLSVLKPSRQRMITLITCYPFRYVGHAPQRFIVSAIEESAAGK